jgi:hypothetical protein
MNTVGFFWFYCNFLLALGLTRMLQISTHKIFPTFSGSLGALV